MREEIHHIPERRGVTRVALMRGDEELSRTLVVPMTMQLGSVRLRMDGIGGVATPEAHRYKGYSRRVLEAAVGTMTAGDAVLSTLYGIPDFYPKYDYATLGPEWSIAPESLEERSSLPDGYTARAGTPADLASIQRIYRQETAAAYGALVREDDWWTWDEIASALEPGSTEIRVVERDGQVEGYAFRSSTCWWMQHLQRDTPASLKIGEAFATDPGAAVAVLATCRLWATDLNEPSLVLAIPPTCRVGAAAMFQNVHVTGQYHDSGEFMGRSTGLLALLRALVPELESRWRPVSCSTPPFAVTIVTGGERATVSGHESGIEVSFDRPGDVEVSLDPGMVARLVLGGFEPEAVLERLDIPAAARSALTTLFPKHIPYIYPLDRF